MGSPALHFLIIDPSGQLVLAILAHPHGFSFVGVRYPEHTAVCTSLATQGALVRVGRGCLGHRCSRSSVQRWPVDPSWGLALDVSGWMACQGESPVGHALEEP